ncbi:MAG: MFS transporter [Thermoflavifilum sp.]|nr:MFS transporter [Thermoflavifilum sp.]MCL6514384.1 MFS transporter [Alicyclobacillus sp.]
MAESTQGQPAQKRFAVLRNRNYSILFIGQVTSQLGDGMYTIALMWCMYLLVHASPSAAMWLAVIPIATFLPRVVVAPLAGVLVDRWRKLPTMIWTDVVRGVAVAVIAILVTTHSASPWALALLAFVLAVAGTAFQPAQAVLIRHIVSREELMQANSLRGSANSATQVLAPAIAGALLAFPNGAAIALWLDAVSFGVSILSLLFMRVQEPQPQTRPLTSGVLFGDIRDGLKAVYELPYTKVLTPFIVAYNFAVCAVEASLIYLYVPRYMHGNGSSIGLINASLGIGEVIGGLVLAGVTARMAKEKTMTLAMLIASLCMATFGAVHMVWAGAVLFFIGGFCMIMVNATFFTRIQAEIPPEWLGRVWALLTAVLSATLPLSNLVFGALATFISVGPLIVFCGLLAAVISFAAFMHPLVRRSSAAPSTSVEA